MMKREKKKKKKKKRTTKDATDSAHDMTSLFPENHTVGQMHTEFEQMKGKFFFFTFLLLL